MLKNCWEYECLRRIPICFISTGFFHTFDDHILVPTGLAGLLWNSRTLDIKLTPLKTCCFAHNIYSATEPQFHKFLAGLLKEPRFGHEYFHRFLCPFVDAVLGWFCGIADILGNSDSSCGIWVASYFSLDLHSWSCWPLQSLTHVSFAVGFFPQDVSSKKWGIRNVDYIRIWSQDLSMPYISIP